MFVGGYAERERVCILCCNARAQSEVPIATKVLSTQDPVPSAPQLTASLPLHRTPEASTKGCPSTVVETVSTTGETETEQLKNPTIGTRIGPQSSGTIKLSNGWALSLTGVCPRTQRNRWTMCPTPFTNSISSRKRKDDTSLSAPPAPFVDLLVVEGVDLILNFDSAWLSGEIRILDGACWLPTARKITFNGNWFISSASLVPAMCGKGITYVPWNKDISVADYLRGVHRWHTFGPDFNINYSSTDILMQIPPQLSAPPYEGKFVVIDRTVVSDEITLSNGFSLKQEKMLVGLPVFRLRVPRRDASHGIRTCSKFIDHIIITGVVLKCGSGNVWLEGCIFVGDGAVLNFGGGNWVFNGTVEISRTAGKFLYSVGNKPVGVVRWDQENISPLQLIKGRGDGHKFGPNFELRTQ